VQVIENSIANAQCFEFCEVIKIGEKEKKSGLGQLPGWKSFLPSKGALIKEKGASFCYIARA
jgi:hypothetical protein